MGEALHKLTRWGIDTEHALDRLLGDEELLLYCIAHVSQDSTFEDLGLALQKGERQAIVDQLHSLKGLTANTGIRPLYLLVLDMEESLEQEPTEQLFAQYRLLLSRREELCSLLRDCEVSCGEE